MNILLIGGIGLGHLPKGGEEYKNQVLLRKLQQTGSCTAIDTVKWKRDPRVILKILFHLFFRTYDHILISASSKSVYQLLRLIRYFPFLMRKTSYFVIGGYFPEAVDKGIYKAACYRKLNAVVLEGKILQEPLLKVGLTNTVIIPNFKFFPEVSLPDRSSAVCRFVYLSKICREKGAHLVLEAVAELNREGLAQQFEVDMYGVMDEEYREDFYANVSPNVRYKGLIDLINDTTAAYKELAAYDCLLFPTRWKGEGFPGVVIDSFVAGLAVIATDWNMNRELVIEGETGLLIEPENAAQLAASMKKLMQDRTLLTAMGRRAKDAAPKYHINGVWPAIKNVLEAK
jgi:glycosyltransferase involved in cell wall biosynthesis